MKGGSRVSTCLGPHLPSQTRFCGTRGKCPRCSSRPASDNGDIHRSLIARWGMARTAVVKPANAKHGRPPSQTKPSVATPGRSRCRAPAVGRRPSSSSGAAGCAGTPPMLPPNRQVRPPYRPEKSLRLVAVDGPGRRPPSQHGLPNRSSRQLRHWPYDRSVRHDRRNFLKSSPSPIRNYLSEGLFHDGLGAHRRHHVGHAKGG
jgi:hypothetical protein